MLVQRLIIVKLIKCAFCEVGNTFYAAFGSVTPLSYDFESVSSVTVVHHNADFFTAFKSEQFVD